MAIKLIANYSKKAGLPGYSSHQYAISVETELTDLGQVQGEATRLYGLLQDAVDREIQHVGFVPDEVYGMEPANGAKAPAGDNGNGCGTENGNGKHPASKKDAPWRCSDKQKEFILRLVSEHDLDRNVIEELAIERFGHGVRELNKLEASGLIDELLETHTGNSGRRRNGNGNGNGGSNRSGSNAGKGGRL